MQSWIFDEQEVNSHDGAIVKWDDDTFFTLTYKGKTFLCEIIEENTEKNQLRLKVNHREFLVSKLSELDELIASLGMDKPKVKKLKELHAPMPGRIVHILVKIGQEIKLGDDIISLEAMKMENVIKAEGVGIVKHILIKPEQIVEKGQMIIEFE